MQHDVVALTSQGRMVGTGGHDIARDHIVGRLEQMDIQPYTGTSFLLPYRNGKNDFANIVGRIPGQDCDLSPILIGAHYDTCGPYPGADDNAAAVAVLLYASAKLKAIELDRTVILAFFDAEEPPSFKNETEMGSIRFYENQRQKDENGRSEEIHCAIIMDLVGHDVPVPGLENVIFVTGMESDPGLESVFRRAEPLEVIKPVPTLNRYVGDMSDHYWFRLKERPYLLLTCGRWEHYHRSTDTPDRLNYEKMTAMVDYLAVVAREAASEAFCGPFNGPEPTDTELYFLRKTIQPALGNLGLDLKLDSREDIDGLVKILLNQFRL